MKPFLLTLTISILPLLALAEEVCNTSGGPDLKGLEEASCDVVNKAASCAEKTIDPDAVGKRFDRFMDFSEKEKALVQKNYNSVYKNNPVLQFFRMDEQEERWAKQSKTDYPVPLVDWFMGGVSLEGMDREGFKAALRSKYLEFAKSNDCTPVIKNRYTFATYPSKNFPTLQEVKDVMKAPDYQEKKNAYFDDFNQKNIKNGSYCEKNSMTGTGPYHYVAETFPPCAGNLTGLYKDNAWITSTLDDEFTKGTANPLVACIKDRIAKGASIHHVSVISSASALDNTGEAGKKFCKKGFLKLSEARALSAKENVLPKLFTMAGAEPSQYMDKVETNFKGSNGDGTSGPCPYMMKDGKEVLKTEYSTSEGKKSLDKNKYIKIHVTFNSQTVPMSSEKQFYSAHYRCRDIYLECAPR